MLKFKNLNLKIVEKFKYFGSFALALIIAGVILMLTLGMNVGMDFAGGGKLEMNLGSFFEDPDNAVYKSDVEDIITDTVKEEGFDLSYIRWSETDEGNVVEIGLNYKYDGDKIDSKDTDAQTEFADKISGEEDSLKIKLQTAIFDFSEAELESALEVVDFDFRIVNSSTAERLLKNSIIATLVAVAVILIYVAIRFTLTSGLAAIVALCHDVLVMLALTTIFRVEVNVTFIAAVITIVGYSINATIVIFDRIRELQTLDSMKTATDSEIANKAIVDTLGRSILTTLTTLVVIVALVIVCGIAGVTAMQEFALPIIFGLIAGAYSSVLLSASFWVYFRKLGKFIKAKIKEKKANKPKKVKN